MTRTYTHPIILIIALLGVVLATMVALSGPTRAGETTLNQVSDWCNGEDGIKYEPVDTPFVVPAPPPGTYWTLLVLKAGTTNETIANPVEGDEYAHSRHDNSHVILCWEELSNTTTSTTTSPTTTSSTSSTTSSTSSTTTLITTTTVPTTTVPSTTTSSSTTTSTTTGATTSTSEPTPTTTTTPASTTTDPPTTTTVTTSTLPNTGAGDTVPLALAGVALVLLGSLSLLALRAYGFGHDDQ